MYKTLVTAAAFVLALTPSAWAQFPPPGVYQCADMNGKPFGSLSLQPAGDYDFQSKVTTGGTGQVASSGTSVTATTGPLKDIGLTGNFTTTAGKTTFMFKTTLGSVSCAVGAG